MKEIITLQLGNYSNFVGSHFWNMQHEQMQQYFEDDQRWKEVNHDVLFRAREAQDGQLIRTPRLVLFDMKGSLERTRKGRELTDEQYKALGKSMWSSGDVEVRKVEREVREPHMYQKYLNGSVEVLREEEALAHAEEKHAEPESSASTAELSDQKAKVTREQILKYLDEETRVWSDFQRAEYHQRSMHELMYYEQGIHDFDVYSIGSQVLDRQDEMDSVSDSIRYFLEDCDSLQAFQMMADTGDSWGAFSANLIDRVLRDELGSKVPILLFECSPFHYADEFNTPAAHDKMVLNSALSFADLYTESTTMIPLSAQMLTQDSFPFLNIKPHNRYQSAAILAAAIDTATLPFRSSSNRTEVVDFCNNLTVLPSMKVSTLCTALPFPIHQGKSLYDTLAPLPQIHTSDIFVPLSPMVKRTDDAPVPYAQSAILRGASDIPLYARQESTEQLSVETLLKQLFRGNTSLRQELSNRHIVENRALADSATHSEMWENYVDQIRTFKSSTNIVEQGLTVPDSFPMRMLSQRLTTDGFIAAEKEQDVPKRKHDILRMPHSSHIQTTRQISTYVQHLHDNMMDITKQIPLSYNTISKELMSEYQETMLKLIDDYEE